MDWATALSLLFGAIGGAVVKPLVDLMRSREDPLWEEIRRLNVANVSRDEELRLLRHERNNLGLLVQALKAEVNDFLEELGRPHKYDTAPKGDQ